MSQLYEALRRLELENRQPGEARPEPTQATELLYSVIAEPIEMESVQSVCLEAARTLRLIAFTDPKCLGAEKFRALAARLNNLRKQHGLKSLQVTSSVASEGKTFVAGNLAATLAKYSGSKTLLIEGDLHRPMVASLFGLSGELRGLSHWWQSQGEEITNFLYRVSDKPLWLLPAGQPHDQPTNILQSARFADVFARLAGWFDWIIVDSTPMQPIVDTNLWSGLVDGTLLVVREGVAPVKALTKGLKALDNVKLVGVVVNGASESEQENYNERYFAAVTP